MRWALTPPFHPYQTQIVLTFGGLFSVALAVADSATAVVLAGTVRAQELPGSPSLEPGLSSTLGRSRDHPVSYAFVVAENY